MGVGRYVISIDDSVSRQNMCPDADDGWWEWRRERATQASQKPVGD